MKKRLVIFEFMGGQMTSVPREYHESIRKALFYLMERTDLLPFELEYDFVTIKTYPLDAARNEAVTLAIEHNVDTTIWVDVDQEFPQDVFFRLLKAPFPIVAGIYFIKNTRAGMPYYPVIFKHNDEIDKEFKIFKAIYKYPENDYFYCDMTGMGCVKIDVNVFKELKGPPYFKYDIHPPNSADVRAEWKFLNNICDVTEDVYFWRRIRNETSYKIVVDPRIKCGHIGRFIYDYSMFKAYMDQIELEAKRDEKLAKSLENICQAEPIKMKS